MNPVLMQVETEVANENLQYLAESSRIAVFPPVAQVTITRHRSRGMDPRH